MFGKQKQTTKWTISPIPGKENTDYDPSLYQNVQTVSYRTNVNYNNQQHSDSDESDETMDNHMLIGKIPDIVFLMFRSSHFSFLVFGHFCRRIYKNIT